MAEDTRSRLASAQSAAATRSVNVRSRESAPVIRNEDPDHMGWFAFGVCLPVPGVLVWFANRHVAPEKCERLIRGVVAGLVLTLVMTLVLFGASSCVGNAVSRLSSSAASAIATAATDRDPKLSLVDDWEGSDNATYTPPIDVSSIEGASTPAGSQGDVSDEPNIVLEDMEGE